jgi:ubiquitin-conjugating enzyme E2 S
MLIANTTVTAFIHLTCSSQNSKSLRRLAADHGALYNNPLPPNYLFPPSADSDSLTDLDILLAGPLCTPFSQGVWKLHLTIPPEYPQSPPTANFRTPIFHPNVDPQSGGVCVETLKRDWDAKLTLRDVLVTICCLLIQPNPDSALNAEAGALIQESYEVFERRARLMTSINAGIPKALAEGVREAQTRGQEDEPTEPKLGDTPVIDESFASNDTVCRPPVPAPAPVRRRRGVARLRSAAASRRSEGSPTGAAGMRRQLHLQPVAGPSSRPFVTQGSSSSDPFGISIREDPPLRTPQLDPSSDDESTNSADQENDSILSPTKPRQTPRKFAGTPRRPQGAPPVPLGELTLEDDSPSESEAEVGPQPEPEVEEPSPPSSPSSASVEEEYPPSPRKSPSKSPAKKMPVPSSSSNPFFQSQDPGVKPQHRSTAALFGPGARNFTPPNGLARPLASDSPYIAYAEGDDTTMAEPSPSPRKARTGGLFQLPAKKSEVPAARTLFGRPAGGAGAGFGSINGKTAAASVNTGAVRKSQRSSKSQSPPSSAEKRRMRDKRLWDLCGGDVRKWNRGDFGAEEGFAMKAARW